MQEEIEQKSFNIMISTTKLSARTVLRAVKAALRLYQSKASQGKQSVRTLLRQNRGVSSVEISKTGIRGLERYAKKYGIDYAIRKDTSEVPPRYLVFFKAPDAEAFNSAFKEYSASVIDNILLHDKLKDFAAFLDALEQQGYEVKRGKHPSVKGKGQRRFIRFRTLGAGYTEEEIKMVLDGKAEHQPPPKQPLPEKKFGLLVDIPTKMAESKTSGYKKWATRFNLKEMSKTLLYLQEKKIDSADELRERAAAATERYHTLGDSIKAAEKRMGEIAVLRAHIVNYAKTRDAYAAYRKAGYSKKFLEAHREEIELHKAAKAAFDEADLKKLPKVKDLNVEYFELLSQKKAAYPEYRKAKEEMQELVRAQKNVERFFAEEKQTHETEQVR